MAPLDLVVEIGAEPVRLDDDLHGHVDVVGRQRLAAYGHVDPQRIGRGRQVQGRFVSRVDHLVSHHVETAQRQQRAGRDRLVLRKPRLEVGKVCDRDGEVPVAEHEFLDEVDIRVERPHVGEHGVPVPRIGQRSVAHLAPVIGVHLHDVDGRGDVRRERAVAQRRVIDAGRGKRDDESRDRRARDGAPMRLQDDRRQKEEHRKGGEQDRRGHARYDPEPEIAGEYLVRDGEHEPEPG